MPIPLPRAPSPSGGEAGVFGRLAPQRTQPEELLNGVDPALVVEVPENVRSAQVGLLALADAAGEIADLAGVGVGTLYRHFPQRSDLIKAVLEHEIDACATAAPALAAAHEPGAALEKWLHRYTGIPRDQTRTRCGPSLGRSSVRRPARPLL